MILGALTPDSVTDQLVRWFRSGGSEIQSVHCSITI